MTDQITISDEERACLEGKVQELIDVLDYKVTLSSVLEKGCFYLNVDGPEASWFMGNHGDVLKSMTHLMQVFYKKKFPEGQLDVRFDVKNSQRDKEKEIRNLAQSACEKLTKQGDEIFLDPLNPYERRIVHLTLQENGNLKTESVGEGHYKRVRILYLEN